MMTTKTLTEFSEKEVLEKYNKVNKKVSEKVRKTTGINPRTRVAGISHDTFSVDISTGKIYVVPNTKQELLIGYLTHENGHRSVFPVSSSASIAFIGAIKSKAERVLRRKTRDEEVIAVANIVADTFSDYVLFKQGLGQDLSKRIPDILEKILKNNKVISLGLAYKMLVYKAIEIATKKKQQQHIDYKILESATNWIKKKGVDESVADTARKLTIHLVDRTDPLIEEWGAYRLSMSLLNPFNEEPPALEFLVDIAVEILRHDTNMQQGGKTGEREGGQDHEGESIDIVPENVDVTDIQKAIQLSTAFGADPADTAVHIKAIFSEKIQEAVKKLLDKLAVVYAQNDRNTFRPSGFMKKKSELWLHPRGEPDEDSVLIEPRKLLWKVTYHVPHPKGKLSLSPASVPEKLVIVIDESGSTEAPFGGVNVISAEAFVSMVVMAGLRYKKGAKHIDIIKFSDDAVLVYSGSSHVEAGVHTLLPSPISGGGTHILLATEEALKRATKNTALVIVTDAEITSYEAEEIGRMLKYATDKGKVGFVVFIVVNPQPTPALEIIRRYLVGKNTVIAHIKDPDDLIQTSQNIMNHILKTYSSSRK